MKQQAEGQGDTFQQIASTGDQLAEQGRLANENAEKAQAALEKQGQTISLFTFITTTFLPLGFLCAVRVSVTSSSSAPRILIPRSTTASPSTTFRI